MSNSLLQCADCARETERRSPSQRYCSECSSARDAARKAKWAAANPQIPRADQYERQMSAVVAAGRERSVTENRVALGWYAEPEEDVHTLVRVAVPFDWAGSKNAVWRTGRGGHIYARKESSALRELLAERIRRYGVDWFQAKVYIDIFVEKPNHRGDAINFLDLVCDAVKDAIDVDDRWFSVRRLDWAIVKDSPRLIVGVSQSATEHKQVCSHCGRILGYDDFGRNRSTKTGRSRVCKDCSAPKRGRRS